MTEVHENDGVLATFMHNSQATLGCLEVNDFSVVINCIHVHKNNVYNAIIAIDIYIYINLEGITFPIYKFIEIVSTSLWITIYNTGVR